MVARRLAPDEPGARPYIALGMSCSNSGFVGFPIMLLALPAVADIALALNMLVENILLLPLLLSLAEQGESSGGNRLATIGQTIWRLRKNPLIVAIFVAFSLSLLEVKLPPAIGRTVSLLRRPALLSHCSSSAARCTGCRSRASRRGFFRLPPASSCSTRCLSGWRYRPPWPSACLPCRPNCAAH